MTWDKIKKDILLEMTVSSIVLFKNTWFQALIFDSLKPIQRFVED